MGALHLDGDPRLTSSLQDILSQSTASLVTIQANLNEIEARVKAHVATMGTSVTALTGVGLDPILPPVVAAPPPTTFPGAGTVEVEAVIAQAATTAGIFPAVLEAIERWETGNYVDPNAGAWLHGNNPGGMKFNLSNATALGALTTPYTATDGVTQYQKWPTWSAGILGHGLFLAHSNYDAARAPGLDVAGQARAIWAAGYSELDPDWLTNVTLIAQRIAATQAVATVPHATTPFAGHPVVAAAIVADAKLFVGHPTSASDPLFTYASDTEAGNLGCADAASSILVAAKVLTSIILAVANLALALIGLGWQKLSPTAAVLDGDVIIWAATAASGGHQHIGIVYLLNGIAHVVANSSANLHILDTPLAGYDNNRPIAYILRAPAA